MKDTILQVRKAIFEQNKSKTIDMIIKSIEQMSTHLDELDSNSKLEYMNAINLLNEYFVMGDLLAVSDLLKFELLPLFIGEDVHDVL